MFYLNESYAMIVEDENLLRMINDFFHIALVEPVWSPSKPSQIKAEIKVNDGKVNICVKIMFPHTGFKVDWKSFNLNGNIIGIYVEVYE